MEDPTTVSSIFTSRKNLLDILKEIGYKTDDYEGYSINHVLSLIKNQQLNLLLQKEENKLYVKYAIDGSRITSQAVHKLKDEFFGEDAVLEKKDTLMVIIKDEPNDNIKETLDEIWNIYGIYITIINIHRLQFNILKHQWVPKHVLLSSEQIVEMKKKYSIQSNSELPTISRYDAVASIICMRPTQVCKIIRKSRTSLESEYYRICN
jgi:DNA-directed RNA polymerase subunit H (RpoH/RPB5)|uniref:RNA polymerase subunit H/Rpb5 C-terminal domain-containing protein n=1 Tax=viral metagenome TaxID=1070528 RepID=A0A6C0B836_9ZZZZ